ncbi:MAG: hypothetical protein IIA09_06565, partial [Proteobacteria bacterium]|nr:hypothetical protein [Pseudomonadota bacterium]
MATANSTRTRSVIPVQETTQYDAMTCCLRELNSILGRYYKKMRAELFQGVCTTGGNAWQLLDAFPWLAVRMFLFDDDLAKAARELVRRQSRLRIVADAADVPMCFQRFCPKATNRLMDVHDFLHKYPDLVRHHCPDLHRDQSTWLADIATARNNGTDEFAVWIAMYWEAIHDTEDYAHWARYKIENVADWIRADAEAKALSSFTEMDIEKICASIASTGERAVAANVLKWWRSLGEPVVASRPFNVKMSLKTVLNLSEEWHERAAVAEAADVPFPDPWFPGDTIERYQIAPITNSVDLSKYAHRL